MVEATDLGTVAQGFLPSMSSVYTVLIWVLGILVFGIVLGVITWIIIDKKRYSKIINIYENQNGVLKKIGQDKARIISIDRGLAKIWYLKKLKLYSSPFVYSESKNVYSVIRKSDGDLENFELQLNGESKEVIGKIMPTSIRMANANIRRYFKDTYKKETFMDKYGKTMLFIIEMVIFGLILIVILDKSSSVINHMDTMLQTASKYCTPTNPNNPIKLAGA